MTIDVPMYFGRWQAHLADGSKPLSPLEGLHDARTRWVVTHDIAQWKDEIAWMSLYFSAAVWASLALCVFYSLGDHLPRYRTEAAAYWYSGACGVPQAATDNREIPALARQRRGCERVDCGARRPGCSATQQIKIS